MNSKMICVLCLLFVMLTAESVAACFCGGDGAPPCEAYGKASAVFVGTVVSVRQRKFDSVEVERRRQDAGEYLPPKTYTFAVQKSFSGVEGGEVEVGSGLGSSDCGYGFVQGMQYLVYAYSDPRSNRLSTGTCTRTKPVGAADEDLAFLRSLPARASGVTISGAVLTQRALVERVQPPLEKIVVGLPIIVEGESVRRELRTDALGRYQVTGLKAGTYTVKLTLPDELFAHRNEEKVTIAERGCGNVSFYIKDNGRISGKVLNADGQPVPKILLYLMRAEDVGAERPEWNYASADEEGRFTFQPLLPGGYLLGVRLQGLTSPGEVGNDYPPTYYPGVREAAKATPITISRAGEHVSDRVLQLPPSLTERILEGVVVLKDNRPAGKALVSYQELSESNLSSSYGLESDDQGRFKIKIYDGFTYLVSAHVNTDEGSGQMHAEPVEVTASPKLKPMQLTISEQNIACERCLFLRLGTRRRQR